MPTPRSRASSPSPRGRSSRPAGSRAESGGAGLARRHQPLGRGRQGQRADPDQPMIDKTVGEQLNAVGSAVPTDRTLSARPRAVGQGLPLDAAAGLGMTANLPGLWLELQAGPRDSPRSRSGRFGRDRHIGIEAETRITPTETKPDCPFPDKITIVPPTPAGSTSRCRSTCPSPTSTRSSTRNSRARPSRRTARARSTSP